MRRTAAVILGMVLLPTACLIPTEDSVADSGALGGGAGGERCVALLGSGGTVCSAVFPVVCGGASCAPGEVCCQTTGACVTPGSGTCPKPPTTVSWIQNPTACGSNADCAADEYCMPDDVVLPGATSTQRCIGNSGHCQPLNNCGFCGAAPGSDVCLVCGCDGRTYASMQVACVAGVHAIHRGRCGVPSGRHDGGAYTIACGSNAQCPPNALCCARTGECFDQSEPWRCEQQPTGAVLDCASHEECASGAGGGSGSEPPTTFCAAVGCGGPGLCTVRGSSSSCSGAVQPVCGCDGVTYVNACWARSAGTRVASNGACP